MFIGTLKIPERNEHEIKHKERTRKPCCVVVKVFLKILFLCNRFIVFFFAKHDTMHSEK